MTFKKIMSAVMAGAMVLSLGATAFAAPATVDLETVDPFELPVEGTTQVPTIKIQVPETVGIIANPYNLSVDATAIGGSATESGQIISPVQYIKNLTKGVDIEVKATVAGYVDGEVEFATGTTATETTKKAYLQIEWGLCDGTAAPTYGDTTTVAVIADGATPTPVGATGLTMKASSDGTAVATNGAVGFHFKGDLTPNEKVVTTGDTAQTPWSEADTFGATVVFNFTPKTNAATP